MYAEVLLEMFSFYRLGLTVCLTAELLYSWPNEYRDMWATAIKNNNNTTKRQSHACFMWYKSVSVSISIRTHSHSHFCMIYCSVFHGCKCIINMHACISTVGYCFKFTAVSIIFLFSFVFFLFHCCCCSLLHCHFLRCVEDTQNARTLPKIDTLTGKLCVLLLYSKHVVSLPSLSLSPCCCLVQTKDIHEKQFVEDVSFTLNF